MSERYILVDGHPVEEPDLLTWARWFETADRHLAKTTVREGVTVSTVFLGLNHAFGTSPPLLWETMIFGGPHNSYQTRASTRAEARAQHADAIQLAQAP